jgi:hypothetical protein
MPGIRSSSDSSGGAMLARALEATPNKDHDGMGSTTNRSDSPSDDEMALVEASDQFNKLVNDSQGYRPLVAADEYHQGHHLRRPSTVRPPNGFVGQQPFGSPGSNVPPSVASSVSIIIDCFLCSFLRQSSCHLISILFSLNISANFH